MDDRSGRYPWARSDPDGYIQAFRHFVRGCQIHAPDAKFVWSPKGKRHVEQFYPGDDYVDYVGFSAFSLEASDLDLLGKASVPEDVVGERYGWLSQFNKPVIVAELGVSGSREYVVRWLQQTNELTQGLPLLSAIVYFNDKEPYTWGDKYGSPDWRLNRGTLRALTQRPQAQN
jgi:beta-mannanase